MSNHRRSSIGGVTVGNAWMYNNPCLRYPEGHESMSENELSDALKEDDSKFIDTKIENKE